MKPHKLFIVSIFIFIFYNSNAQKLYEHELGLKAGFYQLRSDYGENQNSETNFGNQGVVFGLTYYLNQASRRNANYFIEHVKFRVDLLYASANLEHYGQWADDPRLEAMTGSFNNLGLSAGLEYYPFGIKIQSYTNSNSLLQNFSPYTGIGFGVNYVTAEAESSLDGGLENPANVFPTFISQDSDNGIVLGDSVVASLNLRLGIRYDFNYRTGLILESSWMLFGSDLVDGLSPVGPQNKKNDWAWGINIGFSRLLF
jgi:hypothetical protein